MGFVATNYNRGLHSRAERFWFEKSVATWIRWLFQSFPELDTVENNCLLFFFWQITTNSNQLSVLHYVVTIKKEQNKNSIGKKIKMPFSATLSRWRLFSCPMKRICDDNECKKVIRVLEQIMQEIWASKGLLALPEMKKKRPLNLPSILLL